MLCAQRDRFRARCHDLEEELGRLRAELAAVKSAAAAAKADNIALVERLRCVRGGEGGREGVWACVTGGGCVCVWVF